MSFFSSFEFPDEDEHMHDAEGDERVDALASAIERERAMVGVLAGAIDQQEQAAPQQPVQTVAQRRAQLEQQLHQLQAQQRASTQPSFRGSVARAQQWPSAAEDEEAAQPQARSGGDAGQAQAAGAGGGGGSDVLTFSLVAVVVLVAFGFKAHASAVPGQSNFGGVGGDATGSSSSSSYNPVPGI